MTGTLTATRLVTFGIGSAWYAVDVAHVERVLPHARVFPIPNMPSWMEGMIEYRGRMVPVVDLRARLDVGGEPPQAPRRLLVLTLGDDIMAAAVDQVMDVRPIASGDLVPTPAVVRGLAGDCLQGVVRRDEAMVLVLDVSRLLQPDERRRLDDCLAPLGAGDASPQEHAAATAVVARSVDD